MAQKKRLQVFISSTYTDLKTERQAAVEAILTAGHIPAGMELFTAGDESQMAVIQRWIDESDVFLLILGGRYGTLHPKSRMSYTHMEYDYAMKRGKAHFAVVADENALRERVASGGGVDIIEQDHPQELKAFRSGVCGSRIVKFWKSPMEIQNAIYQAMAEFSNRPELVGWVRGDQAVNAGPLSEELARLSKENAELRERLARGSSTYNDLTYDEMYDLLSTHRVKGAKLQGDWHLKLSEATAEFGDKRSTLVHLFWSLRDFLPGGGAVSELDPILEATMLLVKYGLLEHRRIDSDTFEMSYTPDGKRFFMRMTANRQAKERADA